METTYFDCPKQVMYFDSHCEEWRVGIAYHDEIICACCGGIFEIDEIIANAKENGLKQAIYPYEYWVDITYEITGGEMPTGLKIVDDKIVEDNI